MFRSWARLFVTTTNPHVRRLVYPRTEGLVILPPPLATPESVGYGEAGADPDDRCRRDANQRVVDSSRRDMTARIQWR